jgi:hypothetical protein
MEHSRVHSIMPPLPEGDEETKLTPSSGSMITDDPSTASNPESTFLDAIMSYASNDQSMNKASTLPAASSAIDKDSEGTLRDALASELRLCNIHTDTSFTGSMEREYATMMATACRNHPQLTEASQKNLRSLAEVIQDVEGKSFKRSDSNSWTSRTAKIGWGATAGLIGSIALGVAVLVLRRFRSKRSRRDPVRQAEEGNEDSSTLNPTIPLVTLPSGVHADAGSNGKSRVGENAVENPDVPEPAAGIGTSPEFALVEEAEAEADAEAARRMKVRQGKQPVPIDQL